MKPGVYNWAVWDDLLDRLDARGMKAVLLLGYSNPLYGSSAPTSSTASAAFVAYAKAAAKHFAGRGARFEVWNEPDHEGFWAPRDPAIYASFAARVIAAMHATDANAKIMTGGISWFDFGYLDSILAAGAGKGANAIGIHGYRKTRMPETLGDDVSRARAIIARRMPTNPPPIWDTEWGYAGAHFGDGNSESARKRQAVLNVRRIISARAAGYPLTMLFSLRDVGSNPASVHETLGLLTATGGERPAMKAVRALGEIARNRKLVGIVDLAQPMLNGARFDGETTTVWMFWATSDRHDVQLTLPRPNKAANVWGDSLPLQGGYTLREENGPIYLTYSRMAPMSTEWTADTVSGASANDPEPAAEWETESSAAGCQMSQGPVGHGVLFTAAALGAMLVVARRRRAS
jgi:hypothetical protein